MSTRSSLLWGDYRVIPVVAATPVVLLSEQLIHVSAPSPTVWCVTMSITGPGIPVGGANAASMFLTVGIGRGVIQIAKQFVTDPATLLVFGQITDLPAQTIQGKVAISMIPTASGDWIFGLWAAPKVPFNGLQVSVGGKHEDRGLDLDEAAAGFENARRIWRDR